MPNKCFALFLLGFSAFAADQSKVENCFKVTYQIQADEDHYWVDWKNTCSYTIDSVYVMVKFMNQGQIGKGTWAMHFVQSGQHRVIRLSSPITLPEHTKIQVHKITTNSEEALHY